MTASFLDRQVKVELNLGKITRPKMQVLPDSAMMPPGKILHTPPAGCSHQLTIEQPYYCEEPHKDASPAGEFAAGDRVRLLSHEGGEFCKVADAKGLVVFTAFAGLAPI